MNEEQTPQPAPFGISLREAADQVGVTTKTLRRRILDVRNSTGTDEAGIVTVEGRKLGFRKIVGTHGVETRWFFDVENVEDMPEPPAPSRVETLRRNETEMMSNLKSALDTLSGEVVATLKEQVTALQEHVATLQAENERLREDHTAELERIRQDHSRHVEQVAQAKDQTITVLQAQTEDLKPAAKEAEALRRRLEEELRSREAAESKIAQLEGQIYALNPPEPEPAEGNGSQGSDGVGEEPRRGFLARLFGRT